MTTKRFQTQRGGTLIEALIAFLVLSLGAVALAKLHGQLRFDAELARQRGEAVRLAQDELEAARGTRPFAALASATRAATGAAPYRVDRTVTRSTLERAAAASITVRWTDHRGAPQHVVLESLIDGGDPRLSGALALTSGLLPPTPTPTPTPTTPG